MASSAIIWIMILVTGGTGFVGRVVVRHLAEIGLPVRLLLRPSRQSPKLPLGVPVEVAVSSLQDERGLRAAMKDVDVVFHLAGSERKGVRADLNKVDVEGTEAVVRAAAQAGVGRFFYLSHLNVDRLSAFPVFRAKALAESAILSSGVDFTIFRSAVVFGPGDQFTTSLARLLRISPGIFLLPDDGSTRLQPIWVEDLVTCMMMALQDDDTRRKVISLGGQEYLTYRNVLELIMHVTGISRYMVQIGTPYLRSLSLLVDQVAPNFPVSIYWLDYLASDRITDLDVLPRMFGLMPARLHQHIGYLAPQYRTQS